MTKPEPELSQETIDTLSAYLADPARPADTFSYTALRGYLFAIVNAPELLVPSQWLRRVFGENEMTFQSEDEMSEAIGWIMTVWNDVGRISKDEKIVPSVLFGAEDTGPVRQEWAGGFVVGWEFVQEDWLDGMAALSEKHREWFGLCQFCLCYFSDPERYHEEWEISEEGRENWVERMNELFPNALEYYAKVGTTLPQIRSSAGGGGPIRAEKGPGRNDPCPCGSGKKYKKCCLN